MSGLAPASAYHSPPRSSRVSVEDPFATPSSEPASLPALPRPVPQRSSDQDERSYYDHNGRQSNGATHNVQEAVSHKTASMSSEGGSSATTHASSIDNEKSRKTVRPHPASRQHSTTISARNGNGGDPEKGYTNPAACSPRQSASRIAYLGEDETDEFAELQEQNAAKILFFLAGPCVVLSFLNAIWMILSMLITALTQPVRLCARRPTFGQQLSGLAGPALNLQLKSIYTPLPPHADEDTTYRAGTLAMVQLTTPFASLGMMIAAWVAAVFWLASAVVGDPAPTTAGQDKHDDGKETIMALRNWWEKWLVRCIRED